MPLIVLYFDILPNHFVGKKLPKFCRIKVPIEVKFVVLSVDFDIYLPMLNSNNKSKTTKKPQDLDGPRPDACEVPGETDKRNASLSNVRRSRALLGQRSRPLQLLLIPRYGQLSRNLNSFSLFFANCFVLVETEEARVNEIGLLKGPSLGMNEKCIFLNE